MKKIVFGFLLGVLVSLSVTGYAATRPDVILASTKLVLNGVKAGLDNELGLLRYKDSLYVPIRYMAETLGAGVGYEPETDTVSILYSKGSENRKDPEHPGIQVGNLQVVKEKENTKVRGHWLIDRANETGSPLYGLFVLHFYDASGAKIGQVQHGVIAGETEYGPPRRIGMVHPFEADSPDDLTGYSRVRLEVLYLDVLPVRGSEPPLPVLETKDGQQLPVLLSSNCWRGCSDYAKPVYHAKAAYGDPIEVAAESKATVKFDYSPAPTVATMSRYRLDTGELLGQEPVSDGTVTFPSEKGVYVYYLSVDWNLTEKVSFGDASYLFVVRVE